jgi:hypothetical protein
MLRRSERLASKKKEENTKVVQLFHYNIRNLELAFGKKKLFYYENICRLFKYHNRMFMYDDYNNRTEVKYDSIMRSFLKSTKHNKEALENEYIEKYNLTKTEEKRAMEYFNRTIQFIEKYLNKKQSFLKQTILNDDVIGEILSFL